MPVVLAVVTPCSSVLLVALSTVQVCSVTCHNRKLLLCFAAWLQATKLGDPLLLIRQGRRMRLVLTLLCSLILSFFFLSSVA